VVTSYLEILDPAVLRPGRDVDVDVVRVTDPAVNRDLYARVGAQWSWTDKLPWRDAEWAAWAARVETWVARMDGEVAGYYEVDPQGDDVEIASFGLLEAFHGRGLGGHLLTHAIRRGFALGPRVWVHTCTLDGPHALANYEARGMRVYRVDAPR
jgi:ribosomal protein S18 acetylase RimI-like enzyme